MVWPVTGRCAAPRQRPLPGHREPPSPCSATPTPGSPASSTPQGRVIHVLARFRRHPISRGHTFWHRLRAAQSCPPPFICSSAIGSRYGPWRQACVIGFWLVGAWAVRTYRAYQTRHTSAPKSPQMSERSMVVSVHDVSPFTRDSVAAHPLGAWRGCGVSRASLLVVPDHHHRGNITADPAFGSWLRELVAAGHEPVLHGYFHQRARRPPGNPPALAFSPAVTPPMKASFSTSHSTMHAPSSPAVGTNSRLCAGILPAGFIAPAWLLSAAGEEAARDLGFAYTTRLKSVSRLPARRIHYSQSLCWSVRCFVAPRRQPGLESPALSGSWIKPPSPSLNPSTGHRPPGNLAPNPIPRHPRPRKPRPRRLPGFRHPPARLSVLDSPQLPYPPPAP